MMRKIRAGEVKVGLFVFPNHAGSIRERVLIAEIVRTKACLLKRIGKSKLNGFFEVVDIGERHSQAVLGELERINDNLYRCINLSGLSSGRLCCCMGRKEKNRHEYNEGSILHSYLCNKCFDRCA